MRPLPFRGHTRRHGPRRWLASFGLNDQAAPAAELETAQPQLTPTAFICSKVEALNLVSLDLHIRHRRHIFQQEPIGLSLFDDSAELAQQLLTLAGHGRAAALRAELLAGRSADHAIKMTWRWMERAHVAAPEQIGTSDHTVAFSLEATAKQIDSGKQ